MDDGSGFVSMPMLYIDLRGLHQHRRTPTPHPDPMLSVDCPGEIVRPGVREALEGMQRLRMPDTYSYSTYGVLIRLHNIPLNTQLSEFEQCIS